MGSNLLASRLRELEAAGIVERLEDSESRHHYGLTAAGKSLEPVLLSLVRWGLAYGPDNQKGYHHRDDWDLLALKALFQADRAGGLSVCVQFKAEDFAGWVAIHNRSVTIGLGDADLADLTIDGTIKDLFVGPRASRGSSARSRQTLQRFVSAFALPARGERRTA